MRHVETGATIIARILRDDNEQPAVVTIPQGVQQRTLSCLVTAESSTLQLTAVLAPLGIWLSSLRPLVVSYGNDAAALFVPGSRLVRRLEDSGDVEPGDAAIASSLAELGSDMCPSVIVERLSACKTVTPIKLLEEDHRQLMQARSNELSTWR